MAAGNLLWAHLLRKDATSADSPSSSQIPIAPQDKTGTSMRMLIHDTQVNLEKFSERLDGLLHRVDDCRAQVVNANKLLDVERDKVLTEIQEMANGCQKELKAHVGTPAQAPTLELVRVSQASTENSVHALEKRMDALQALIQTHAHAMQSIQDQQNTLMATVLPLVPIIHGVPPQMDQIKKTLTDVVANAVSTMTDGVENIRSTLVSEFAQVHGFAGSGTRIGSSSKSMYNSRRKRLGASALGRQDINDSVPSPLDNCRCSGSYLRLKRTLLEDAGHPADDTNLPRKLSRMTVPPTSSACDPVALRTPRTPRQPLADLLLPTGSNTPRSRQGRGHMRPLRAAKGPLPIPSPMSRVHPFEQAAALTRDATMSKRDKNSAIETMPSEQDFVSKAIKIEEVLEANFAGVISIESSPLSTPPSSAPRVEDPPPLSHPVSSSLDASPPKSMSLRDRRAQISKIGRTETRRFIPLVPWSDDEQG